MMVLAGSTWRFEKYVAGDPPPCEELGPKRREVSGARREGVVEMVRRRERLKAFAVVAGWRKVERRREDRFNG